MGAGPNIWPKKFLGRASLISSGVGGDKNTGARGRGGGLPLFRLSRFLGLLAELAHYRHTKRLRASKGDAPNLLMLLVEPRGIEPLTS